ncbi:MAG: hypothetical protein EOO02_04655 [Chitinophagaceae bacterium]|nr:MAG: hypothetical protein EOO02_04655 [Chitinophagaceae bacterium]
MVFYVTAAIQTLISQHMALRISYLLVILTMLALPAKLVTSYLQYTQSREAITDIETEEENSEPLKTDKKSEYIPVFQSGHPEVSVLKNKLIMGIAEAAALSVPYFSVPTPPPQIKIA